MTLCLAGLEGVRKPGGIFYQRNHTTIARELMLRTMEVGESLEEITLSYNDINMAQTRDGSRFRKIFRSV